MDGKLRKVDALAPPDPHRKGAAFRVGILPLPGFALMSYASTTEPLRAANLLSGRTLYRLVHFAAGPGAGHGVPSSGAATVAPDRAAAGDAGLDLLLVIAGGDPFAAGDEALFSWLRRASRRGVRLGGVSGGPVVLARAGLLAGRRMTVHWEHAAALAERFPDLIIERRLFVMDRDRMTCGGGTAPVDMMHALIAEHHGAAFARQVADWFLHTDIRAAAAPQRGGLAERMSAHSPHVLEAVAAMENHIGDPLGLRDLAMIAGVGPRHLNRLFAQEVGESAMAHYRRLRLHAARRLLRSTSLQVAEIASATGFANAGHFSNAYLSAFGHRPRAERAAVAGAAGVVAGARAKGNARAAGAGEAAAVEPVMERAAKSGDANRPGRDQG